MIGACKVSVFLSQRRRPKRFFAMKNGTLVYAWGYAVGSYLGLFGMGRLRSLSTQVLTYG